MAVLKIHRTTGVLTAIGKVVSAHVAMKEGISTHAERHAAELDARRKAALHKQAIENGIARQNRDIQAAG